MIHFEGDRSFTRPIDVVFAKLGDASFLVSCLKEVEEVTEANADKAAWKQRPGLSFIRTTLDTSMEIVQRDAPKSIKVKLFSRGIGATSTIMAELVCSPADTGTKVHWLADVTELTGLLKLVPKGLITSSASKIIEETWSEIEKKLHGA